MTTHLCHFLPCFLVGTFIVLRIRVMALAESFSIFVHIDDHALNPQLPLVGHDFALDNFFPERQIIFCLAVTGSFPDIMQVKILIDGTPRAAQLFGDCFGGKALNDKFLMEDAPILERRRCGKLNNIGEIGREEKFWQFLYMRPAIFRKRPLGGLRGDSFLPGNSAFYGIIEDKQAHKQSRS